MSAVAPFLPRRHVPKILLPFHPLPFHSTTNHTHHPLLSPPHSHLPHRTHLSSLQPWGSPSTFDSQKCHLGRILPRIIHILAIIPKSRFDGSLWASGCGTEADGCGPRGAAASSVGEDVECWWGKGGETAVICGGREKGMLALDVNVLYDTHEKKRIGYSDSGLLGNNGSKK